METERQKLGIIGLGAFGRFMAKHLSPWFDLKGYDPAMPSPEIMAGDGAEKVELASLAETASCDIVVFSVPVEALAGAAGTAAKYMRPGILAMDVTSVKVRPVAILSRLLPKNVDLFCTHPLFGPQSGRSGIASLRIALCPVRVDRERYHRVFDFLTDRLRLLAIKTTPEDHDREMAKVQAMTHFMSRVLKEIGLEPSPMATRAYEKLQEFSVIALSDSWDLFLTIQNGNPYALETRRRLIEEMEKLERRLECNS
ncbi:MAG: prephenate dehydrogenase/arogenate dehydrogenase family protein [Planctomycetota bacterium]|jgi:prephenate dehydrogenase|nr:prephenate dehydrogenase/arogenate dehydrogenase family protein [Planctomycetota bacterium]